MGIGNVGGGQGQWIPPRPKNPPPRPPRQPRRPTAAGSGSKGTNKTKHFGATFSPGINFNINAGNKTTNGGGAGGGTGAKGRQPDVGLPDPEFDSPAQIRNYCNTLRALATGFSFELSMAAEILQVTLAQVPDPEGKPFGSRMRARRVARKLAKAADAMKAVAVSSAATYATFNQEFKGEVGAVRHRARPSQRRFDWADQ